MADVIEQANAWLAAMPDGNFDAYPGGVAEDFVLRLPFVPPGVPNEFHGREKAMSALQASAANRAPLVFTDKVMLRTEDPELVLVTARAETTMGNGRPYRNEYVILIRIRDGVVIVSAVAPPPCEHEVRRRVSAP